MRDHEVIASFLAAMTNCAQLGFQLLKSTQLIIYIYIYIYIILYFTTQRRIEKEPQCEDGACAIVTEAGTSDLNILSLRYSGMIYERSFKDPPRAKQQKLSKKHLIHVLIVVEFGI